MTKKLRIFFAVTTIIAITAMLCTCGSKTSSGVRIKNGVKNVYTLKAADGGGKIALYDNDGKVFMHVPDGTELTIFNEKRDGRFKLYSSDLTKLGLLDDKYYSLTVDGADIAGETGASVKAGSNDTKRQFVHFIMPLLYVCFAWLLIVATRFILTTRAIGPYNRYYNKKRKEFPWLDNYIKNNGNPSKARASNKIGMRIWITYVVLGVIILYHFYRYWFMGVKQLQEFSAYASPFKTMLITAIVCLGFELVTMLRINPAKVNISDDHEEEGMSFECPKCKCPHSWKIHHREISNVERVTVTTTTKIKGGPGVVTRTKQSSNTFYRGDVEDDYVCECCGHTAHSSWSGNVGGDEPEQVQDNLNLKAIPDRQW